ncbi:MAG: peptidoglycan DD-metalloendopeptidase family protein [Thermodesulfobacteriota bacterium]
MGHNHSPLRIRLRTPYGHSARAFLVTIFALACTAVGLYLICVPGLIAYFPSVSALSSNQSTTGDSDSCPAVHDQVADEQAESERGTIEDFDTAGPEDTLYSLMMAQLNDEASVRKVTYSLAEAIAGARGKPFDGDAPLPEGAWYSITLDNEGAFLKTTLGLDAAEVYHAEQRGTEVCSWKEDVVLELRPTCRVIEMKNNLMQSIIESGESGDLAAKITKAFRWDIDFQSETKRGDVLKVLFERRYADDRPSGYGEVLCAIYEGKKTGKKTAILFKNRYHDENGTELRKDFLRAPLTVLRRTSGYGMRRHPIHNCVRKHHGLDYGAPTGTPVMSIAGGTVTFAGWKNGYGKFVCITHDNGIESRYGHLSKILVEKGKPVKQTQKIGLVGRTGDATGPHLHFEVLVGGKNKNPQTVLNAKMVTSVPRVAKFLQDRFQTVVQERLEALDRLTSQRADVPRMPGSLAELR